MKYAGERRDGPTRVSGLIAVGMAIIAGIAIVTPLMSLDEAAFTGTALSCLMLLVKARLRPYCFRLKLSPII